MSQQFVLATGNKGKVKELATVFAPFNIALCPQSDFNVSSVEETGLSFIENAIIKARHASKESGLPALADDSGLAVDALGGQPGIYSARFAGEDATDDDNIDKLLTELAQVPSKKRAAQFHCALVFVRHWQDPTPIISQGIWAGEILTSRRGDGGFGYDPVFWVASEQCSAAQLTKEQKSAMSHRGHAVSQLIPQMQSAAIFTS